jgi:hypothetical protein
MIVVVVVVVDDDDDDDDDDGLGEHAKKNSFHRRKNFTSR